MRLETWEKAWVKLANARTPIIRFANHTHRSEGESDVRRIFGQLALAKKHGPAIVEDAAKSAPTPVCAVIATVPQAVPSSDHT